MTERKTLPPLDLTGAKLEIVGPAVMKERRKTKGSRERTKVQRTVDTLVEKAYAAWEKAGKPADWSDRSGGHVRVPSHQEIQLTRAIMKAGAYLNMSIRFGSTEYDKDETGEYADVVFTATDRPVRAQK